MSGRHDQGKWGIAGKGPRDARKIACQEAFAIPGTGCVLELKEIYRGPNPTLQLLEEESEIKEGRQQIWGDACVRSRGGVTSSPRIQSGAHSQDCTSSH